MSGQDQVHDGRRPRGQRSLRWWTSGAALHLPAQRPSGPGERVARETADADPAQAHAQAATRPTRRLCALVYIEEELRSDVDEHFPVWRRRAWAPCYSIDLMPLLYHARRAASLALLRDGVLSLILLGVTAMLCQVLFGLKPLGLVVIGGTAAVVAVTRLIMVRREASARSLGSRLWRYARSQWRQFVVRTVVVAATAAVAFGLIVTRHEGRLALAVLAAGLACGWLVTMTFTAIAYARASSVASTVDFAGLEEKLPADLWQRAREAAAGNILIYTGARARGPLGPFVGAGHRLAHWTTPSVDVNKRRDSQTEPQKVEIIDLHHRLHAAVSDLGIPNLRCEHRLYVDGAGMPAASALMDPGTGRPRTWIPEAAVLERLGRWAKFQRTYLCLQASSPNGDIVVTMFVHAMLEKDLLQLEIGIHALPEVSWPKTEPDSRDGKNGQDSGPVRKTHIPPTTFLAVLTGLAIGTRTYWPTLLGALRRTVGALVDPLVHHAIYLNDRRMIAQRRFEFGAQMSLRESLAMNQRMHHNLFVDMMAQAERLQRRLTDAVAEYLKSLGIDPGDFAQQSLTIFNNIQHTIISTLNTGAAAFGHASTATGTMYAGPHTTPHAAAPAAPAAPATGATVIPGQQATS